LLHGSVRTKNENEYLRNHDGPHDPGIIARKRTRGEANVFIMVAGSSGLELLEVLLLPLTFGLIDFAHLDVLVAHEPARVHTTKRSLQICLSFSFSVSWGEYFLPPSWSVMTISEWMREVISENISIASTMPTTMPVHITW